MENQQLQQPPVDTRVSVKKGKKREFKNRKTFSLKAMESLVDRISFLKTKYDTLAVNAQEKLGYHYNEILNILLFHKYVKSNKKLFEMYKKIKDAINKGYDFDKQKKLKENTMKKVNNKNKNTHFAINKNTNKILESWNYEGYDQDELKKYKNEYFTKDVKRNHPFLNENEIVVVTSKNLEKRQLNENNKKDWQKYNYSHFALLKETNHILYGYDYSNVDKDELKENKNKYFLNILSEVYGSDLSPQDVVVVKSSKLNKLGIKDYLNESNWAGLINEAYCGSKMEEEIEMDYENDPISSGKNMAAREINWEEEAMKYAGEDWFGLSQREKDEIITDLQKDWYSSHNLGESSDVGSVFGAEGMPVANPYMRPKKGFDLSDGQDMYKAKNMLPSVKKGIKSYQTKYSNPVFHQTSEPEFITPVKTTHFQGTKKKAMKESYDLVDLDALLNDDIVEYRKITAPSNAFKSPKVELLRENNRDSIIEFLLKHQGHELPEFYNKRQLNTLSLKTLNEYYSRLVQRLGLLEEEKRPDALIRIDALNKQTQKDSNNYYKKDASNKTTTMLVQKGEGDGLVYDKDSLQRKDIPKYKYQSEHQKQYLEKGHRGLEDFQPELNPNGEVDPQWLARKEALMSTQEVGANAFKAAEKRIKYKKEHGLGKTRGRTVKLTQDLPKVDKADELIKENTNFQLVSENNILDQIQSYYIDEENRKKPVIFDANNVIEVLNEKKLVDCKELNYKGLGQTLSEEFKNKVLNKKLLYSPSSKKVYLV